MSQQLAFTFHRITGPGLMDQQMEIVNDNSVAVVPRLRYTPVDSAGAALDGVIATAAYGSNEGKMMAPARQSSFDVLAFTGRDVAKVAGVQVGIESLTMDLGFPTGAQLVQPQALDGEGQPQQARAMVTLGYVTIDAHASVTLRPRCCAPAAAASSRSSPRTIWRGDTRPDSGR